MRLREVFRQENLGEGRAEPRTVYPLLSDPSVAKRNESAAWHGATERSEGV